MPKPRVALRRVSLGLLCLNTVAVVRIALYLTKFHNIQRCLTASRGHCADNQARAFIVARTVRRVAAFVPGATCLTQAISAQAVLSWFGVPTEMVLGAARAGSSSDEPGTRETTDFHAWLLWNGKIILGGEELKIRNFVPFSTFPTVSPD